MNKYPSILKVRFFYSHFSTLSCGVMSNAPRSSSSTQSATMSTINSADSNDDAASASESDGSVTSENNNSTSSKPLSLSEMAAKQYWSGRRERRRAKRAAGLLKRKHREPEQWQLRRRWKNLSIDEIEWFKPTVLVDCQYDRHMTAREIRSLKSQLMHLYGHLRIQERPLRTHMCAIGAELREQLTCLGANNWRLSLHNEEIDELFDKSSLVYLSPDSENILEEIDEERIYVIGGIVDHNRFKHMTLTRAREMGIETARLPIVEVLGRNLRNSLNVNHVFEILAFKSQGLEWRETFEKCFPNRYKEELDM